MKRALLGIVALACVFSVTCAPYGHAASPAIGWLDTVGVYPEGQIRVTGWAATSDAPQASLGIRVRVDGQLVLLAFKVGHVYRPDVRTYLGPQYSDYLGFDKLVPAPFGTHTVCIEAQNNGVYYQLSGCLSYSLPNPLPGTNNYYRRFMGGSFVAPPGQIINKPITVTGANASKLDAILTGAARWGQLGSLARFYQVASPTSDSTDITLADLPTQVLGSTTIHYCTMSSSQYVLGCEISWSTVTLASGISDMTQLRKTSAHELGHALGLAHPNAAVSSVMNQGNVGGLVSLDPTSYDTGGCAILYPITYYS